MYRRRSKLFQGELLHLFLITSSSKKDLKTRISENICISLSVDTLKAKETQLRSRANLKITKSGSIHQPIGVEVDSYPASAMTDLYSNKSRYILNRIFIKTLIYKHVF